VGACRLCSEVVHAYSLKEVPPPRPRP
jgi:hypothetical protein